ncbi:hypothetical protein Bpfe_025238, partial [Biomphalaria pfeifferi]
ILATAVVVTNDAAAMFIRCLMSHDDFWTFSLRNHLVGNDWLAALHVISFARALPRASDKSNIT